MLSSIRVVPVSKLDKMFTASRINYGKVYTVEHNVKVYNFGDVHRGSLPILLRQWERVFGQNNRTNINLQPEIPSVLANTSMPAVPENETQPVPAVEPQRTLPLHATAIFPREDTTEGYLLFQKDDRIFVTKYKGEWAEGRNETTGQVGLFPRHGFVTLDPLEYATALKDNEFDKKKPDRLVFEANDRILVKGYLSANWDMGYNTRTGEEGRYAHQWVRMDRGRYATALYDYPYDESRPGHLVFKAKDRILVTDGDETKWARGRNESTRQEGKFPGNYIKFNEVKLNE